MTRRRLALAAALALAYVLLTYVASGFSRTSMPALAAAAELPARFSDQEYWKLMSDISEPNGNFRSDNLVSNEIRYQDVVAALVQNIRPGGVYLGVGPEQNFTYIAAMRPDRVHPGYPAGERDLHLMYKALFELSADRADFVSRLFSRRRPDGLSAASTAAEIFSAFAQAEPNERVFNETLAAIRNQLVTEHRFALSGDDLTRIESIYKVFFLAGTRFSTLPVRQFRRDGAADL